MEIQDNIQWHPAFCSAVELELRDYKQYLTYEREHNLGRMPLKIDLLIIKKRHDIVIKMTLPISFSEIISLSTNRRAMT